MEIRTIGTIEQQIPKRISVTILSMIYFSQDHLRRFIFKSPVNTQDIIWTSFQRFFERYGRQMDIETKRCVLTGSGSQTPCIESDSDSYHKY